MPPLRAVCYTVGMEISPDDVRATLEAGRHAAAGWLRSLADRVDRLPVDDAAQAVSWLGDRLAELQREAERFFSGRTAA